MVPVYANGGLPDHPRVRGEHRSDCRVGLLLSGSSPRARGTQQATDWCDVPLRIIPACAGNTGRRKGVRLRVSDHPRVRGEHLMRLCHSPTLAGSSPRARGTPPLAVLLRLPDRIIPACAGNTRRSTARNRPDSDHPRVRGEHRHVRGRVERLLGSSPRARGTHHRTEGRER